MEEQLGIHGERKTLKIKITIEAGRHKAIITRKEKNMNKDIFMAIAESFWTSWDTIKNKRANNAMLSHIIEESVKIHDKI